MNFILLSGRMTKDPETRYGANGGTAVSKFQLAVQKQVQKDEEEKADFISCVAFAKTAQLIENYCKKGSKVFVKGHWSTGHYDTNDGRRVYTNECTVDSIEFVDTTAGDKDGMSEGSTKVPKKKTVKDADTFMNIPDGLADELPFN